MGKILVFGSFVVDLASRGSHLPVPGETVIGSSFQMGPGGKGFNQGIAAGMAGGDVAVVTKLGRDSFAKLAEDQLKKSGMSTEHLLYSEQDPTGTALIVIDENSAQNCIMIVPGACATISQQEVAALEPLVREADYVVTQLETNLDATQAVIEMAHRFGAKNILNPAPAAQVADEILANVDLITPNEVEAEAITGIPVDGEEAAAKAAEFFFQKGIGSVVITLGSRGVYAATRQQSRLIPAYCVQAVDTTGAGDAFNGGLAVALSEGKNLFEACEFASAVAAISVTRRGTAPAMPARAEVDEFLKNVRG